MILLLCRPIKYHIIRFKYCLFNDDVTSCSSRGDFGSDPNPYTIRRVIGKLTGFYQVYTAMQRRRSLLSYRLLIKSVFHPKAAFIRPNACNNSYAHFYARLPLHFATRMYYAHNMMFSFYFHWRVSVVYITLLYFLPFTRSTSFFAQPLTR